MSGLMIGDPLFLCVFSAGQAFHHGHLYLITRRQACGHTALLALSCFPLIHFYFTARSPSFTRYAITEIVASKPEFLSITEQAVLAALDDPAPANPIAIEVARLVTAYTNNFRSHAERLGYVPAEIHLPLFGKALYKTVLPLASAAAD
jgi:hypothetical protein